MKKLLIISLLLGQIALVSAAGAVQLFDFDAQAIIDTSSLPGDAMIYGKIVNGGAVETPIPLDFANFEYTIFISALAANDGNPMDLTSGDGIFIFADATTAADWSDPGTFTDGTVILSGVFGPIAHTMFTATLGSANGLVDWTGGTRLDDLAPSDRIGWPLLTGVSRSAAQVLPGYTERWDGKVEPTDPVVATDQQSWSRVKVLFR